MTPIHPLSHGEIEHFLVQITVLLLVAYMGGRVVKCWKQPPIIGNILGGVLLGPSVLGHWLPNWQILVFTPDQNQANMLSAITWLGLLLFLMEAGLDVNLNVLRRTGKASFLVSAGGLAIPLLTGLALGFYIPESLLIKSSDRLALSLFLAVSMSISALPPISMVLREKNIIQSKMGQIALGAAMLDDIVAWILVAVMTSLYLTGGLLPKEIYSIIVVMAIITVILAVPLMTWAASYVKPENEPTDPCELQFICEETLVDPHAALDAVENEEIRLAKKLKGYCTILRKIPGSNEHDQLDSIVIPFNAISTSIEGLQKQLASQTLCPGTSALVVQ